MSNITLFLIALGLAMDAFAVSISNGISLSDIHLKHCFKMAFFFGFFQFAMTLIGYIAASLVSGYIEQFDHWIAFILLIFIGGKMIYESFKQGEVGTKNIKTAQEILTVKYISILAVATSIDAMAMGISFAVLRIDILYACIVIGVVAFVVSFIGILLGKKLGGILGSRAELFGGLILIGIGFKILIEGLF